jgi:Ca2+-transporting ATPase
MMTGDRTSGIGASLPDTCPAADVERTIPCNGLDARLDTSGLLNLGSEGVFRALATSPRGLAAAEIAARRAGAGRNELPTAKHPRIIGRLLLQFTDLFAMVLLGAATLTFIAYALQRPRDVGNLELAFAILAVVILNAAIGFGMEYSAERTAEALSALVPRTCRVLRDGERVECPAADLVPGDVVVLDAGDAVCADCRVVEAHELRVNNAPLTGESAPAHRTADACAPQTALLEARNVVFMGTTVVAGAGKAVVFATGAHTEFGRIFDLTATAPQTRSPLQRQVDIMAKRVSVAALLIGAAIFAVRAPLGRGIVASFVFSIGVMVALVPEGLPATLSVSLAVGVRRMARRHALVKRLLAVEALGSTTVICTDKTGTLTRAEMTVVQTWHAGHLAQISGVGYDPTGQVADASSVRAMLVAGALCSNARLLPPNARQTWRILGDTTEGALLVAAAKAGIDIPVEESSKPRLTEFPFDSTRKLMTTVHRTDGGFWSYTKGAPQELLEKCSHIEWSGGRRPMTDELRSMIRATSDTMAHQGLRVLAIGGREIDTDRPTQVAVESDLTLYGLVALLDPPRQEVSQAVRQCRRAGVRVVMVTGDHPLTAEAIARRVGIVTCAAPTIVTGRDLDAWTNDQLDDVVAKPGELLFSRVSPEHKMRVVEAFERHGDVVAVTGDGANDAPALKRADVGVAMGVSGTDVAREAAAMVLLDDSFASIGAAIELGRSVYQNIRKFLIYLFSHNIAELAPIVAATIVGFPLVPLLAVQVLAIDLGSDVLPALALGAEPPELDVMDRPPRAARESLFSAAVVHRFLFLGTIQSIGVCFAFFWRIHSTGMPLSSFTSATPAYREAITMTQAGIVISQFFNGLAVRTERRSIFQAGVFSNPRLIGAECIGVAIMAAISYLAPLQRIFHTAPLTVSDWAMLVGFGILLLAAEELRKLRLRYRARRRDDADRIHAEDARNDREVVT